MARHILILAIDETSAHSDSITFDILHRLMEYKLSHLCVVECVQDENRSRLRKLKPKAVLRPVRTYPEIIITSMFAPGSEKLIEELVTHEHEHPRFYEASVIDLTWADVVSALIQRGLGTALAYINEDDEITVHPAFNERISCAGLIVIVHTDREPLLADVQHALDTYKKSTIDWERPFTSNQPSDDTSTAKH